MLAELTLRRFRSFRSAAVRFGNPLFLVGRNGAGKSNLADALSFLGEAMELPLSAVCERRGGMSVVGHRSSARGRPANMGFRVRLRTPHWKAMYAFELQATRRRGVRVVHERCIVHPQSGPPCWFDRCPEEFTSTAPALRPALHPGGLALPLMGGDSRFEGVVPFLQGMRFCRIEPGSLRELQTPGGGTRLDPAGDNAASVLRAIRSESQEDFDLLQALLTKIVPGTVNVRTRQLGNRLTLEFTQDFGLKKPVRFPASSMSDGTLRAVGLLAAVFQRPKPSLLVIEEPEATMHTGALGAVQDLVRHASRSMQIVVTTHSPDLLEAKWIEPDHLRLVAWKKGSTRIGSVSSPVRASLESHLSSAGELLRANVLESSPKIDPPLRQPSLFDPLPG